MLTVTALRARASSRGPAPAGPRWLRRSAAGAVGGAFRFGGERRGAARADAVRGNHYCPPGGSSFHCGRRDSACSEPQSQPCRADALGPAQTLHAAAWPRHRWAGQVWAARAGGRHVPQRRARPPRDARSVRIMAGSDVSAPLPVRALGAAVRRTRRSRGRRILCAPRGTGPAPSPCAATRSW